MSGYRFLFVFFLQFGIFVANEEVCLDEKPIKYCRLRENVYDQQLWKYWTGYNCYLYTNRARLNFLYKATGYLVSCRNTTQMVPVAVIDESTFAFYDYTNETSMAFIRLSYKTNALFSNFLKCCREAVDCCENHMNENNIKYNETHCPAIWDAWSCFPPTKMNTIAKLPCSSQAYQSPDDVCTLESEKSCIWNQTVESAYWVPETDYAVCAIAPVYKKRHEFHVIFLMISIVFCVPAIAIFLGFEKLRRTIRVVLHRNLLIAIVVRNCLTITSKQLVILDALKSPLVSNGVLEDNSVGCRVLAFLETSSKNCMYGCMLLDGFYLHKVIVRAFAREVNMIYMYGILGAITFLPSLFWAASMGTIEAESCWMVDADGLQWIVDSFRIVILVVNTILLMDIIRVMLLKLKQGSTSRQTKSALRATLFLIPLFGIHIIVTAKKIVYDDSCIAEDAYDYARYAMEGLQGVFVAILFCYANSEVHNEIKNGYRKLAIYLEQKYGWSIGRETIYRRRTTTATYVQPGDLAMDRS